MIYAFATIAIAIIFENTLRLRWSSRAWRARIVETVFALGIGFSALTALALHGYFNLSVEDGVSAFGRTTLFVAIGFFAYHLHRVIFVPGFTKSLIAHHLGMILCIAAAIYAEKAYFYLLIASIPITSAAVRNFRWFWKMSRRPQWQNGAVTAAIAYLAFESIPPIWGVIHFFSVGIYQMDLPTFMWVSLVAPGLILSAMTFYWSALFVRKTLQSAAL